MNVIVKLVRNTKITFQPIKIHPFFFAHQLRYSGRTSNDAIDRKPLTVEASGSEAVQLGRLVMCLLLS